LIGSGRPSHPAPVAQVLEYPVTKQEQIAVENAIASFGAGAAL
jgi:hypothetical protein